VKGIPTRKVDDLVRALGVDGISKSEVSRIWTLLANSSLVVCMTSLGPSRCGWTNGHGAWRSAMSLHPNGLTEIPAETARVARAAFPKGCLVLRVRDALGVPFTDEQFAELFAARGRPAWSPARLALVLVLQFVQGLTDRPCRRRGASTAGLEVRVGPGPL
jgi:hypothetical protein